MSTPATRRPNRNNRRVYEATATYDAFMLNPVEMDLLGVTNTEILVCAYNEDATVTGVEIILSTDAWYDEDDFDMELLNAGWIRVGSFKQDGFDHPKYATVTRLHN